MEIEFDPEKRAWTLAQPGLDMARAGEVFAALNVTFADGRHDHGEVRCVTVGHLAGRMVLVVWTPQGASRRIISMRKANGREQAKYRPLFEA